MWACPAQTALCRAVMPSSLGVLGSSTCKIQNQVQSGPLVSMMDDCHMITQESQLSSDGSVGSVGGVIGQAAC